MFKISNNTLFMEFDGSNTLVMEVDADYVFDGDVINTILDESCIYYGSSLNGRIKGSKNIIGSYYKLPVIVSERNNIVFFPLKKVIVGGGLILIVLNVLKKLVMEFW